MVVGGEGLLVSGELCVEGISLVGGALAWLPKEVDPRAILPLGPLNTWSAHFVRVVSKEARGNMGTFSSGSFSDVS